MNYQYLGKAPNGNSRYKITLNVYRDCYQSEVALDDKIKLGVYLNNADKNRYKVYEFSLLAKYKVQPPGSVDCDYYAKNVCIEYGLYEGVIELATYNGGYHLTFVRCCRNIQNNLPNQGGSPFQGQTYYCYIPNTTYENSSPVFSGVPSPYMCANDTTTFLFNAFDPDGDELTYKIVRPFQGGSPTTNGALPDPPETLSLPISPVIYNPGYNSTKPFGITNGSMSTINSTTGLTTFLAPAVGSYVVCVEVTEKRNGVVLSTIRMDLQILVLDCPPNKRPNVSSSASETIRVEAGSTLCFDVYGADEDDDIVKVTGSGPALDSSNGFSGTLASFTNKAGIGSVTSEFCWEIDCDQDRDEPYIVTFEVEDDGCPPKFNYISVEIYVDPFVGTNQIDGPTEVCRYNAYVYTANGGKVNSTYEWEVTNGNLTGDPTSNQVLVDWDGATSGSIRMREISEYGCPGEWTTLNITIKESPPLPVISGKDTVCLNEVGLTYSVALNASNTYTWINNNCTFSSEVNNTVTVGTYGTPTFTIKAIEINEFGCASDTAIKEVYVSEPNPQVTGPTTVCPNAFGVQYNTVDHPGSVYTWGITGGTIISGAGTSEITVDWGNQGFGQVNVFERNRHGCISPLVTLVVNKTYTLIGNPIDGPTDVCEFDQGVVYSTLEINGSVHLWNVVGGTQVAGDSSHNIVLDWGATGLGRVTMQEKAYDLVNNRVCLSNPVNLDVVIHPKPTATIINGVDELCQYNNATYTINGFANSTYEWAIDGDTSGINGQGTNTISVDWNTAGVFVLSVLEMSEAGCAGTLRDTVITVNPKPTTTPISGTSIICPENVMNHTYKVTGSAGSVYNWSVFGANSFTGQGTDEITVNWEKTLPMARIEVVEVSDKGCVGDTQRITITIDRLDIDLRFVSVGNPDDRMLLSWEQSFIAPTPEFTIEKRNAGMGAWTTVDVVPGYVYDYLETGINTDNNAFEYRISAINQCGTTIYSEVHTNINLVGYQDEDFNINIDFSAYLGWLNGVDNYMLYEGVNNGALSLKTVGVNPNQNTVIQNTPDQYKKCYRIYATELEGEQTNSWSNEICFYFSPEVFVPNAFTANGDNLNDGFGVKGLAINEYSIRIYSRWGEKLYESENINEKWYPTYKNDDVMMGTYVYIITYTDFENKVYTKTGTINLLR
jgi:gliding motility-associated-like protein